MSPPADDPIDTSIPALPALRCASGSLYNCVDRENTGSSSPEAIFFCSKGLFLFMDWGCELLWHGFVMHIYIRRAAFTLVVQYCGDSGLQLCNNKTRFPFVINSIVDIQRHGVCCHNYTSKEPFVRSPHNAMPCIQGSSMQKRAVSVKYDAGCVEKTTICFVD